MSTIVRLKRPLRYVMGLGYVAAGLAHFLAPDAYEQVVPPAFPHKRTLVYLSGVAEVMLGTGVIFERTRRAAAWGLLALLAAVFPANVHMATADDLEFDGVSAWATDLPQALLWARLPMQGLLALWAWWHTRPDG
jgi:uncharacterized membrane protein